jgi:hypothetical protein
MAYDEELASRVRVIVEDVPGLTEKRMFGGLAFLVDGNLAVSASGKGGLMVRVDPDRTDSLLDEPRVRRMEMRGRQLDGWLHVDTTVVDRDPALQEWVGVGLAYARSLPAR